MARAPVEASKSDFFVIIVFEIFPNFHAWHLSLSVKLGFASSLSYSWGLTAIPLVLTFGGSLGERWLPLQAALSRRSR
jgi:hypothetical protein